ncbi:hypothetical protein BP5796_12572 [Coleophoma crateriformis]|uniref:Uncharacterized protein n=1 Tax=Coleophoma crateriformis TaxID=565419 RepID=A0A3D8Q7I9_9HELO|nr:hypothetical protein BP5796_12572 [Coleophoma crateriformis]
MAFWGNLISWAGTFKQAKAFVVLIEISFDINNGLWIDNMSTHILTKAVRMGANKAKEVVGRLLDTTCAYDLESVLFEAVRNVDSEMTSILLDAGAYPNDTEAWFCLLGELLDREFGGHRTYNDFLAERTNLTHCIQILLEAGVNWDIKHDRTCHVYELAHSVDWCSGCGPFWLADKLWFQYWRGRWDADEKLFRVLTHWSWRFKISATIPGIVMAARGGVEDLEAYLAPRLEPQGLERQILFEVALSVAVQIESRAAVVCLTQFGVDSNVIELDKDSLRPWNPVFWATPDIEMLQILNDAGADLNLTNALARTCSHAMPASLLGTIRWLIENGADLTEYGQEAMIEVCGEEDDVAVVEMLVAGGTPLGGFLEHKTTSSEYYEDCESMCSEDCEGMCSEDCEGMNILQLAIRHDCSLEVVRFLIQQGLAVTSTPHTCDGRTMLHDALLSSSHDRPKTVALLLEHGADVKASDGGLTILEAALPQENYRQDDVKKQSVDLFRQLLNAGAPLASPPKRAKVKRWTTALVGLIKCGADDSFIHQVIDQYLAADGDIDQQENSTSSYLRLTPLQAAAQFGRVSVAKYLIERGADINSPGHHAYGMTALQAACDHNYSKVDIDFIKHLISRGAIVNAPASIDMATALAIAARNGSLTLVCLLLDHGADPNMTCRPSVYGFVRFKYFPYYTARPLDFAAVMGRLDMVQLLRDAGGLSGVPGISGFDSAIFAARRSRKFAIVDFLQQSPRFSSK